MSSSESSARWGRLADLAACRIDADDDDFLLENLIKAARQYVEGLCGPLISQTWYQYDQDWPSDYVLQIGKPRLQSVTSIVYTDEDAVATTLTASWYTVRITDEFWSQVVLKSDYSWPTDSLFNIDPIVTEFVCGYGSTKDSVPEPIKIAILMLVAHWYEERQPATVANLQDVPLTVDAPCWPVTECGTGAEMSDKVTFKQGEAKTLTFTVTETSVAVDLSGCTLTFGVKNSQSDTAYSISKVDGDFAKSGAASGIVSVSLTESETNLNPGVYVGELKVAFAGGTVDKSGDLKLVIEKAVIPVP